MRMDQVHTLSSQDMLAPCIVKYASTSFDVTSPNTTSCSKTTDNGTSSDRLAASACRQG